MVITEDFIRDMADKITSRPELQGYTDLERGNFLLGVRQMELEMLRKVRDI